MKKINFAQVTGLTSPNPLTLICTKKADGVPISVLFRGGCRYRSTLIFLP